MSENKVESPLAPYVEATKFGEGDANRIAKFLGVEEEWADESDGIDVYTEDGDEVSIRVGDIVARSTAGGTLVARVFEIVPGDEGENQGCYDS